MSSATLSERRAALGFCIYCWGTIACVVAVIWASFAYLSLDLSRLFTLESGRYMLEFVGRFFPPDLSAGFLQRIAKGALETLAISALVSGGKNRNMNCSMPRPDSALNRRARSSDR